MGDTTEKVVNKDATFKNQIIVFPNPTRLMSQEKGQQNFV